MKHHNLFLLHHDDPLMFCVCDVETFCFSPNDNFSIWNFMFFMREFIYENFTFVLCNQDISRKIRVAPTAVRKAKAFAKRRGEITQVTHQVNQPCLASALWLFRKEAQKKVICSRAKRENSQIRGECI